MSHTFAHHVQHAKVQAALAKAPLITKFCVHLGGLGDVDVSEWVLRHAVFANLIKSIINKNDNNIHGFFNHSKLINL